MLRALLHRLGLQTEFYLTRAFPLPSTLVVAAAACLLPSASAYSLLAMTASPSSDPTGDSNDRDHPGSGAQQIESSGVSDCTSIMPKALPCSSRTPLGMVLGMIEVQPAPVAAAAAPARGPNVRSGLQLSCPVAVHLQALLALKQQLRGKMGKLQGGSYPEDMELAATAPAGSPRRMALVSFCTLPTRYSLSYHMQRHTFVWDVALMTVILYSIAQVYRAGQKEIAHAALAELAQQTTSLLDTSLSVGSNFEATPGSALETLPQQDGLQGGSPVRERLAENPWDWGLEVLQDCEPGQELARVPLAAGFLAGSRADLVSQLALMRLRREPADLSTRAPETNQPACGDACEHSGTAEAASRSGGNAFLDRLIRYVDVPFAATLLSGDEGSLYAIEALAGVQLTSVHTPILLLTHSIHLELTSWITACLRATTDAVSIC